MWILIRTVRKESVMKTPPSVVVWKSHVVVLTALRPVRWMSQSNCYVAEWRYMFLRWKGWGYFAGFRLNQGVPGERE